MYRGAARAWSAALGTFPAVVLVDYPRRNVETFSNAFFQSCQYMTGEAWSTTMYWYMEHSHFPQWATGAFFVLMFVWLNAVLFSLFVAVLLVNFGVDEDEMMPKQRTTYELEKEREEGKVPNGRLSAGAQSAGRPVPGQRPSVRSWNTCWTAHCARKESCRSIPSATSKRAASPTSAA